MKSSFSLALLAMLTFIMGSVISCTGPTHVDDNDDDEFESVESNADDAFNDAFGDGDEIAGDSPSTDMSNMTDDDMDDPIKEDNKTTTDKPATDDVVGIDRYNKYWSNNMDPDYPSKRYLIGIGAVHYDTETEKVSAKNRAAADGRSQIAAYFKAQIQSKIQSESQKVVTIQKEVRHVGVYIKDEYDMTQSVQESVKGAECKKYAYDEKHQIVYALVVLDRKRAADGINEKLKSLKSQIEAKISVYQTAYSEEKIFKATTLLVSAINMIIEFRSQRQEAIFIAPEGYDIVDLDGIEEGGLIQQLAEITIDLTIMVKSRVTTTDEDGVTTVQKLDSVTSQISAQLRKSSNLIMLKRASAQLRSSSFDEVSSWSIDKLKASAPDTKIIILANLEAEIVDQTEFSGRTAYTAKTTFTVQMIDVETGEIVHSIDSGEHNLHQATKAMLNNPKSALNASIGNAAEAIAKQIFKFLNP